MTSVLLVASLKLPSSARGTAQKYSNFFATLSLENHNSSIQGNFTNTNKYNLLGILALFLLLTFAVQPI